MLRHFLFAAFAFVVVATGPAFGREGAPAADAGLVAFAERIGLDRPNEFAEAVATLRRSGKLPARYVSRSSAERLGWRPGDDLCRVAPGRAIGGERFANRQGRLPAANGRTWREADLDFACGRRGARRLVWSNDGLVFVTLDHYESFIAVPP